ncbi:MAG: hypothetical protein JXD22_00265 [Sedimentisphaerales bacterium]|nr:hypothetical protein [Sedimentisphaerales bacterium]
MTTSISSPDAFSDSGSPPNHLVISGKPYFITFRLLVLLILTCTLMTNVSCTSKYHGLMQFDVTAPNSKVLLQPFSQAYCCFDQRGLAKIVVLQSNDDVRQTIILNTFWNANKAITSVSPSSTNANIDYLIEYQDHAALYRGAGFVLLKGDQSDRKIKINLLSSNLNLEQQTISYKPPFLETRISGKVTALNDSVKAQQFAAMFEQKAETIDKR